jgi:murein DD-endopeptidase MepM/ murein hydrolase activator NlpD
VKRADPASRRLLRAGVVALLLLPCGFAAADAPAKPHHARHAKATKSSAKRRTAHVLPGATPDVVIDADLAGGGVRHGCAAASRHHEELLASVGVYDADVLAAFEQGAPDALEAVTDCVPYALTVTRSGSVRALGLHVPGAGDAADRLVMLSRESAAAPVQIRSEDLGPLMRDVTTVTMPLREVAARTPELQAAVPAEALYSLTALVPLLHAPAADEAGDRYLVRAAYETGTGPEAGRLLSAELLDSASGEVIREALWIERHGLPGGYFAPDGASFEHALWTAPVTFTRISRGIGNFRTTVRRPVTRHSGHKTRIVMVRSTRRGTHVGVDFAAPIGAPVISVADGRVVDVGMRGGYGNLIVIEHAGGYTTRYGHLSGFAPDIEVGSEVRRGSEIGYVGTTGFSTGPHLHFEIRRDGVYFDPLDEQLAFGLWSMRAVDYVPMMRQTLIAEASDRLSGAGRGTVLAGPDATPRPAAAEPGSDAQPRPLADHSLAGNR